MKNSKVFLAIGLVALLVLVGINLSSGFASDPTTKQSSSNEGWFKAGSQPKEYDMGVTQSAAHSGKSSGYISSNVTKTTGFGTYMQMIKADAYRDQRIRLTGYIKSKDVASWAGMWMRVDGEKSELLGFDNMQDRPIKGTSDWQKYEIVLDVPAGSQYLAYGVLLDGTGNVYMDDFKIETVDKSVPTTGSGGKGYTYPAKPSNLNFED